jgi:hypothetical protein
MTEFKSEPVILKTDMPEKIQKLALEYAEKALVNHPNDNSDMAEYIKNEFEKKFGPYWACFGIYELILKFESYFYFFFYNFKVGNKFGSYFSFAEACYISFYIDDLLFLLFKYP